MEKQGSVLAGMGVGLGLMYFLDPDRGRRRRALVRDRVTHAARLTRDAAGASGRDLTQRASGVAARLRAGVSRDTADDRVLAERVRSRLGREVSHPHAVDVAAVDGVVTLRGPVLRHEVPRLLDAVERVRGVRSVVNQLEEHKQPGAVPALQGGGAPPRLQSDILQRQWSPTARVMTCLGGTALAAYGVSRRDLPGALLSAAGMGLLTRATTNLELRRLTGIGASRRAVDVHKTITIDSPPDEVFAFWSSYENFPRFMSRVLDVRPSTREGQSHWTVAGPGGVPVEFDAEVSACVPNDLFAWRTVEGSAVAHAGIVRFKATGDRRTRIDIRMSYNPPGGWLGHGVAAAFGVDPRSGLDADLARMKTLLETGRPARDAAQPQVH
jgi:uncharacterized membrane protein